MTIRILGHALRLEVADSGPGAPRKRPVHDEDEGGRGLHLVELLSSRWGHARTATGKVVWFELPAPDHRELTLPARKTSADAPSAPTGSRSNFTKLITASGLPPVRLHDLRHGAASLALQAGADLKVVQDQLGPSSIVLTADTYVTVLPDVARKSAENVSRLVLNAARCAPGSRHHAGETPGLSHAVLMSTPRTRGSNTDHLRDSPQPRRANLCGGGALVAAVLVFNDLITRR